MSEEIKQELIGRLRSTTATIGVFGLGYVGLPLAMRFSEVGYRVIGFDIDPSKVDALGAGDSYLTHVPSARIARAGGHGFSATDDFSRASHCDALILCVPTPLDRHRQPDLSFVRETVESILPHMRPGQVVSLESTSYPGTTEEELLPRLLGAGCDVGGSCFLVYSPEREDPGNLTHTIASIPKVVGGYSTHCLDVGLALYEKAAERLVPVSSMRVAEMVKLLENIHRAVNIGLVNELKLIAERMGMDIHEVIDAAATKPFGFTPYYPGPGLGGHCIPIDPFYLTWKAREYGFHTRFIELAGEVNRSMPEHVVLKLLDGLNEVGKPIKGSRILVLGVAYKKNVNDLRESPALEIMQGIQARGGRMAYSDPLVPEIPRLRDYRFDLTSVTLTAESLSEFDAVVLVTDHDDFDYDLIGDHARLIVDTRGRFRDGHQHLFKA